ncbi:MAG: Hsp70 family protein [Planctomycetota bacterium]
MSAQFVVGIDLGTTNSVVAFAPINADGVSEEIQLLPIPQLVAAGTIESRTSLPSFMYLATESEQGSSLDLPWSEGQSYAVGQYAQSRGAEAPNRTVVAAKSWLCHQKVDRRAPVLPFQAPEEVPQVSPVDATTNYLTHLISAWNEAHPDALMADQSVVLTVPASFDPVARELTREAALAAGLPKDFVLLEEPQAALYAWLDDQGDDWRSKLSVGKSILVCDIGGGTTDLTLVVVDEEDGNLILKRVAVGDHLLVGGDNMDLAAAHFVAGKFAEKGTKLNPWQSISLWHSCRKAKETLLQQEGPETHKISVLGRGSKLIGGTVSIEVERESLASLLLDGFFPACDITDQPQRQAASGFQEIGLPFESDPGVTRHIAEFVSRMKDDLKNGVPDFVLFNGGVFKAEGFQNRLLSVINAWASSDDSQVESIAATHDLDNAVARGACFYGINKLSGGMRIRGGVAHSYYVGIESAGLAIPGMPRPLKALCVVPYGMEEGTQIDVPANEIGLVVGQPVSFRFFRSNVRPDDSPGVLLEHWEEDLEESDPLHTTLKADELDDDYAAVTFESRITEIGMFELWCNDANHQQQWKLEFNVREETE